MAQPITRSKKKPRAKAKPLKKATQRHCRYQEAQRKTVLAVVASLVLGMLQETERCLRFEQQKDENQAARVRRWSNACLDGVELGRRSLDEARATVHRVDDELRQFIAQRGPKNLGHYAIAWLVLGYLCDEARYRYAGEDRAREWRFLSSVVNTFAERVLANAPEDQDYEEIAGEAALHVWDRVFEMPAKSWIRL
jgi:hypothetical protein